MVLLLFFAVEIHPGGGERVDQCLVKVKEEVIFLLSWLHFDWRRKCLGNSVLHENLLVVLRECSVNLNDFKALRLPYGFGWQCLVGLEI